MSREWVEDRMYGESPHSNLPTSPAPSPFLSPHCPLLPSTRRCSTTWSCSLTPWTRTLCSPWRSPQRPRPLSAASQMRNWHVWMHCLRKSCLFMNQRHVHAFCLCLKNISSGPRLKENCQLPLRFIAKLVLKLAPCHSNAATTCPSQPVPAAHRAH